MMKCLDKFRFSEAMSAAGSNLDIYNVMDEIII